MFMCLCCLSNVFNKIGFEIFLFNYPIKIVFEKKPNKQKTLIDIINHCNVLVALFLITKILQYHIEKFGKFRTLKPFHAWKNPLTYFLCIRPSGFKGKLST